jgi:hypothetical protein
MKRAILLPLLALLGACGASTEPAGGGDPLLVPGAGPDGAFYAAPVDGGDRSVATRWPIVLSHPFSETAEQAFRGDSTNDAADGEAYGVKKMLEAGGAVVYQPDKLAFGSHETRGQLLYKRCAGTTLNDVLCKGRNPVEVDGIHWATRQYCADPALRARNGFAGEDQCRRELQFNIICHSQGCPDSRYMLAAVRDEYTGEPMYRRVASWTSMAGANKGTALADFYLKISGACLSPGCRSPLLDALLGAYGAYQNRALIFNSSESVVALSRKYMLDTTDMDCNPATASCPPSFNQLYPLPVDAAHPVFYQTFSSQIDDIAHPCYRDSRMNWQTVMDDEGANDGYISVDSQKFTTYGRDGSGGATPVIARWVDGTTLDPAHPHPGLDHMAYGHSEVPGMDDGGLSCAGEDNRMYRFSRVGLYRDIVAELVERGF